MPQQPTSSQTVSNVRSHINTGESIGRVALDFMKQRRTMSTTTPHKMLWFAILSALVALAVGEVTGNEANGTSSESPKPVGPVTTDASPPREAVTDIFAAPLASFKVPVPPSTEEEIQLAGLPLGKAENGTESSTSPPFSNLWFNAGQSLGSAANSLTGWLNSRLSPQTTTTTTRPPEVIVRFQSQQGQRKPLISIEPNRNPQDDRVKPTNPQEDEDEDDDDDVDDDEDYDADGEEEQADEEELKPNRYSGSLNEQDDDDEELNDDEELDEDEEVDVPIKKHTKYVKKPSQRITRLGYNYNDDDDEYLEDYEDDDDYDDYELLNPQSARQQQQQSLLNRFRQLTQMPYASNNKKQNTNQPNKGYRPVRIVQNGQVIQLVEDRPSQQKVKRQRRPGVGQPTYQLVPIQTSQMSSGGGGGGVQQQNKRRVNKPDNANNIYIPLPQGTSDNKKPGQYITIPWSQLGITNNQQDYTQNGQQATPFVVNLQQLQNSNRRRPATQMPANAMSNPQRKRLKRPTKNQNAQVVSLLTEENIRDIFRVPQIPPSRTPLDSNSPVKRKRPLKPLEVPVDDDSTSKPLPMNPETEVVSEENEDDESQDDSGDPYIIVGDDDSNDEPMSRHASSSRFAHIGGMKPYVDVLNKGRIYLKPGGELRMSRELQTDNLQPITAINPEFIEEADKDVIRPLKITTESSSEAKPNNPQSSFILGSENASTPNNPLPPQQ